MWYTQGQLCINDIPEDTRHDQLKRETTLRVARTSKSIVTQSIINQLFNTRIRCFVTFLSLLRLVLANIFLPAMFFHAEYVIQRIDMYAKDTT